MVAMINGCYDDVVAVMKATPAEEEDVPETHATERNARLARSMTIR